MTEKENNLILENLIIWENVLKLTSEKGVGNTAINILLNGSEYISEKISFSQHLNEIRNFFQKKLKKNLFLLTQMRII